MALTKEQKQKIIEDLKEKVKGQKAMIFVDFTGLKVKDLSSLRNKLKAIDSELKVAKKTLLGLALKDYQTSAAQEVEKLKGEVAIIFGFKDELSSAKIIYQFSQENPNLKILGGFIESQKREFINAEDIIELAQLPAQEELLARLVGSISAPISNFVNVLQGNIKGLIYILTKVKA